MVKKIDHVNISVSDMEASKAFFIDLLDFQLDVEGMLEGEWIDKVVGLSNVKAKYAKLRIPGTETRLELIQYYTPKGEKDAQINQANKIGFRHIAFEVKNIENVREKLKSAGLNFYSDIQTYNGKKKLCYFYGPDGIILELAEYKDDFFWCDYVVAHIDILGQKKHIRKLANLPKDMMQKKQIFLEVTKETVYFIEELREGFANYFYAFTQKTDYHKNVPAAKQKQFDEMTKTVLKYRHFSDYLQAFVPLEDKPPYDALPITGIFGVLCACGGMLLLTLNNKKSFRAGIDLGLGTEFDGGEGYGLGFLRAYELESHIAQWPRIVVGNSLIEYLRALSLKKVSMPNQSLENIEYCKRMADNCLEMIVSDIDEKYILDYLGNNFYAMACQYLPDSDKKEMVEIAQKAYAFVQSEYQKLVNENNEKLSKRYFMLYNYFTAKLNNPESWFRKNQQ